MLKYVFFKKTLISVPSILRNSRYRRDQRQLDEEEEMWFNEEEDFDDAEAVVPGAAADLAPQLVVKKQSPTQNSSNPLPCEPKNQQPTILNNNTANNNATLQTPNQVVNNNVADTTDDCPITADISPSTTIAVVDKVGTNIFKKVSSYFLKNAIKTLSFLDIFTKFYKKLFKVFHQHSNNFDC